MKNLKAIKTATISMFLLINIPYDHISPFLFMLIPFLFLNYLSEMISFGNDFVVDFLNFTLVILLILSLFKIYSSKKTYVISSIIIQLVFLIYMYKISYLNYWYYYLPTSVYLLLSLYLIMELFVLKTRNTNK